MKRLLFILWIFLLSVSFGLTKMKADVRMPLIFGDHMVLQQDTKIAIFGWADAGETVEVVFAGQKVKTTADTDGMESEPETDKNEERRADSDDCR